MTELYRTSGTAGMNPGDRRAEAERIIPMLLEEGIFEKMNAKEKTFVQEMDDDFDTCSDRQLFWLRDLKARYVE